MLRHNKRMLYLKKCKDLSFAFESVRYTYDLQQTFERGADYINTASHATFFILFFPPNK